MELVNKERIFLRSACQDSPARPAVKGQQERAVKVLEAIYCRACGGVVTAKDQKVQVSGSHHHTFFNPAGLVFELGCFRRASGCLTVGSPSTEFAWFPGYSWQIALCRGCQTHLGWLFVMEQLSFFGLILKRLRE